MEVEIQQVYVVIDRMGEVQGVFAEVGYADKYMKEVAPKGSIIAIRWGMVKGAAPDRIVYLLDKDNTSPYQLDESGWGEFEDEER